jgi:GT2 family glycosyltransferase
MPLMTNPLTYVITLNWNRKDDTLACLESLVCQTLSGIRVLVIDNHSTDGSPEEIANCYPQVEQIVNSENLGFAAGFNIGLRFALDAGADYIFILNNDTFLAPDCLEQLMQVASPEDGILAPLIYYASQPQRIWALGGSTHPLLLEKHDPWTGKTDPGNLPKVLDCDFVTGCAMFFPRKTLNTAGLFDEMFQMYYEDSDLCLRVRRAGLRIRAVPPAHMWHKVASSSGGSDTPAERYWMARSSIRFFHKHARGIQIPAIAFWRTGSALRTTVRLASLKKWASLYAYWRGLRDGIIDMLGGGRVS